MNTPLKMLLIILCMDLVLFLGQTAVHNINPDSTLSGFEPRLINQYQTSPGSYDIGSVNASSLDSAFPGAQRDISGSGSGFFPDIWNTIRDWIFNSPLGIILQIFGAPFFFLKAILPGVEYAPLVWGVGAVWFAFSLFAVIGWALGRE
jgi:hypothetical protein